MSKWNNDTEYLDYTIEKVEGDRKRGWYMIFDGCTGFYCPPDSPVEPKVGMTMRQYGAGFGSIVRGLFLDNQCVFYRTEAEQAEKNRHDAEAEEERLRAKFEANREAMDAKYAALPKCFRDRIDRFRTNNPDFRWKFETYEVFTCEQAVIIADALKSADAIRAWHGLSWKDQKAAVPGLDDGHSGNTFGMACRLAIDYLQNQEAVRNRHGALAPLVGSEEYGCVAKPAAVPSHIARAVGRSTDAPSGHPLSRLIAEGGDE